MANSLAGSPVSLALELTVFYSRAEVLNSRTSVDGGQAPFQKILKKLFHVYSSENYSFFCFGEPCTYYF